MNTSPFPSICLAGSTLQPRQLPAASEEFCSPRKALLLPPPHRSVFSQRKSKARVWWE